MPHRFASIIPSGLERAMAAGRPVFAAAIVALGIQCLFLAKPVQGLEPLPAWLPWEALWAIVTGVVLVVGGAGLAARKFFRVATFVLAGLLLLWVVLLLAPRLIVAPTNGGVWTGFLEALALAAAAWALLGQGGSDALSDGSVSRGWPTAQASRLGRIIYGATLLGFGALHLIYWQYVASVIPAWLPGRLFWTYFTAAAFFAAGSALVSGIQARSSAAWTGVMFLLWVVMLHLPRAATNAGSRAEWTSLLVALAMGGGAWILAKERA